MARIPYSEVSDCAPKCAYPKKANGMVMQKTNLSNHLSRSATANNLGLQWMKFSSEGHEFSYKNPVHVKKGLTLC